MNDYYPPKADFIVKRHMYVSIESAISSPMYVNEKRNIKRFEKKNTLKYFVHTICIQEFNNAYAKHLHFHNTYLQM